jgi:hypothetical protein
VNAEGGRLQESTGCARSFWNVGRLAGDAMSDIRVVAAGSTDLDAGAKRASNDQL